MNDIRIIIAGSRRFSNYKVLSEFVEHVLKLYVYNKGFTSSNIEIVCGMAQGADMLGKQYAEQSGFKVKCFPADWDKYGKVAGLMRNKEMAKYASEHYGYGALIAFWDGKSRGTDNMINNAIASELKVFVYNYTEDRGYLVL